MDFYPQITVHRKDPSKLLLPGKLNQISPCSKVIVFVDWLGKCVLAPHV